MATARQTEPWSALLDAGRADGRLVREAFEGAREPTFADIPGDLHPKLRGAPTNPPSPATSAPAVTVELWRAAASVNDTTAPALDDATRQRLRQLGYVE